MVIVTGAVADAPTAVFTEAVAVNTSAAACPLEDAGIITRAPKSTVAPIVLQVTVIYLPLAYAVVRECRLRARCDDSAPRRSLRRRRSNEGLSRGYTSRSQTGANCIPRASRRACPENATPRSSGAVIRLRHPGLLRHFGGMASSHSVWLPPDARQLLFPQRDGFLGAWIDAAGTAIAEWTPSFARRRMSFATARLWLGHRSNASVDGSEARCFSSGSRSRRGESGLAQAVPGDPTLIPSIFHPESTPAHSIYQLSILVLAITGLIFVVVFGLIVYAIVRYRRRPDDDGQEPAQVYGSTQVELAWTVIPVLIVVVLSLTGARAIDRDPERAKTGRGARSHRDRPPVVVGVPVSRAGNRHGERTARAGQRPGQPDADIPQAAVRRRGAQLLGPSTGGQDGPDPEPRQPDVDRTRQAGLYLGQCAEYCGTQHAKMLLRVYVHTREDFDRWVQRAAPAGGAGSERCRRPAGLRDDGLHQLPRGRRHGRHRHLRSRPHPSHEPGDVGVRRGTEHAREPADLDSGPGALQAGLAHAGHEPDERELDQLVAYLATLR